MQISADEERVIVKHFFKVGYAPKIIGAVTREAATDNIIHTAARHCIKAMLDEFVMFGLII